MKKRFIVLSIVTLIVLTTSAAISEIPNLQKKETSKSSTNTLSIDEQIKKAAIERLLSDAHSAMEAEQYPEAYVLVTKAIRIDKNDAHLYSARGVICLFAEDYKCALKNFNKAEKIDKTAFDAQLERAEAYVELGQYKEALIDLDEYVVRKPNDILGIVMRAFCNLKLVNEKAYIQNLFDAIAVFEIVEKDFDNAKSTAERIKETTEKYKDFPEKIENPYFNIPNLFTEYSDLDNTPIETFYIHPKNWESLDKYEKAIFTQEAIFYSLFQDIVNNRPVSYAYRSHSLKIRSSIDGTKLYYRADGLGEKKPPFASDTLNDISCNFREPATYLKDEPTTVEGIRNAYVDRIYAIFEDHMPQDTKDVKLRPFSFVINKKSEISQINTVTKDWIKGVDDNAVKLIKKLSTLMPPVPEEYPEDSIKINVMIKTSTK